MGGLLQPPQASVDPRQRTAQRGILQGLPHSRRNGDGGRGHYYETTRDQRDGRRYHQVQQPLTLDPQIGFRQAAQPLAGASGQDDAVHVHASTLAEDPRD